MQEARESILLVPTMRHKGAQRPVVPLQVCFELVFPASPLFPLFVRLPIDQSRAKCGSGILN